MTTSGKSFRATPKDSKNPENGHLSSSVVAQEAPCAGSFPHCCDPVALRNSFKNERFIRAPACRGFVPRQGRRGGDLHGRENTGLGIFLSQRQMPVRDPLGCSRTRTQPSCHPCPPTVAILLPGSKDPTASTNSIASWNQTFRHETVEDTHAAMPARRLKRESIWLGKGQVWKERFRQKT